MRRARAAVVIGAAGLAGQIGVSAGVAVATTPPTEPPVPATSVSEEQAAAEAALLVLSDFPTGWTAEVEEEPTEQELAYQAMMAECAGGTGNLLELGGPRAKSPDFVGPDELRVEQSVTIVDTAVAEDFMARFAAPGVEECFGNAVSTFVADNFASQDDPSQTLPGDVTIGKVTIGEVLIEPAGDEVVAYRVTLPMSVSGLDLDAFVDIVAVRAGGSIAGLTFQSLFEPFPAEDVEHYVGLAVERLPG
jgi:hypothetical protein